MNERLWEIYAATCEDDARPLGEFVDRLLDGEWGPFPPDDVLELLREIEARVLANIQIKTEEGGRYAAMADEVAERTRREFSVLAERIEAARGGPSEPSR